MSDTWKDGPPADLDLRVQRLLGRAKKLGIDGDLLVKYARLVIAAEEVLADREKGLRETRGESAILAAAQHGIWEDDPARAKVAYQTARKGERQLHNSARALASKLAGFEKVLTPRYPYIQNEAASKFPLEKLLDACQLLREFATATTPFADNLLEFKFAKSPLSLTKEGHALQWWHLRMPKYVRKWENMYALARCWHLSAAKDIIDFRRVVRKLPQEKTLNAGTFYLGCPPWAAP
jgi:hypothetical protein